MPVTLASDQSPIPITTGAPYVRTPMGYQQITNLSAATGLTVPVGATVADITVEGNSVRYRDDGTAPTASVGMPLIQTQSLEYTGSLAAIEFIQSGSGALLNVSYYK